MGYLLDQDLMENAKLDSVGKNRPKIAKRCSKLEFIQLFKFKIYFSLKINNMKSREKTNK